MEVENSPSLEAEFSLPEEEFFGERLEEKEADNSDTAGSDSDSVEGTESNIGMESCDVEELQAIQRFVVKPSVFVLTVDIQDILRLVKESLLALNY